MAQHIGIVGIGNTRRWYAPDRSPFDQLQEASVLALEDAGLRLKDVDGLFCSLSTSGLPVLNVAERLGISERTVRRLFKRIQAKLTRALDESAS